MRYLKKQTNKQKKTTTQFGFSTQIPGCRKRFHVKESMLDHNTD